MRGPAVQPILIAAGGTGGHFFPAEALAAALLARGHAIALMTDARSGALRSQVFAGHPCHVLPGAGLAGRSARKMLRAAGGLSHGVLRARHLLRAINPAVVVAFGGYPSVPPVLAAATLRRRPRIILQEQNAVLGRANRFLARFADRLALGFAETARLPCGTASAMADSLSPGPRVVVTGNPVRPAITPAPYAPAAETFHLLVTGGSLGARVFSDVVPPALAQLPAAERARLRLVQQCRAEDLPRTQAAYAEAGIAATLSPFFAGMAAHYARAHLVIGRAGASTCAELAVTGRPAILVPLPHAIDDHQAANAAALQAAGAATVLPQAALSPQRLATLLMEKMQNPQELSLEAQAAAACARPHAADDLADLVESLATEAVR